MATTAQAGEIVRLRAADGHSFDAYLAEPAGRPRDGIVILMEIFGLTPQLRGVSDAATKLARERTLAFLHKHIG